MTNKFFSGSIARLWISLLLALTLLPPSAIAQTKDRGLSLWGKDDVSYLELVKLLNDNLSDAQQVNIFNGACHAAELINTGKKLTMPYFVGVGHSDANAITYFDISGTDEVPPGRLTISGGYSKNYFYSFSDYVTKRLKNADQIPTVQQLYDAANSDVRQDPGLKKYKQTPASGSGNKAKLDLAINGGTKSNHALIFDGNRKDLYEQPGLELYRALVNAKYGFQNKGNSLQYYDQGSEPQDYQGTHIDGPGTLANLKAALQKLKNLIKDNPNQEMVNIFFDSHGYQKAVAAPRQGGLNGVPKDGLVIPGGAPQTLPVPTDAAFWQELKVGILPNEDDVIRIEPPTLVIDASESSTTQPIGIAINGIPLGYFDLPSSPNGAELKVPLPDWFTNALIAQSDGSSYISVTFTLAQDDFFRVATEDDILLSYDYAFGEYGFGVATVVKGTDPPFSSETIDPAW